MMLLAVLKSPHPACQIFLQKFGMVLKCFALTMLGEKSQLCLGEKRSQKMSLHVKHYRFLQGCMVREKLQENEFFFQVREKSGNFVDGQGNLERSWKVREKSVNLKINGSL